MEKKNCSIFLLILFLIFSIGVASCNKMPYDNSSSNSEISLEPLPLENDILVVYFSYSGNTKNVANEIISQSNCYGVEIIPSIPYKDIDVNYNDPNSRNQVELKNNARPEISLNTYKKIDILKYETVIIGYPIWNDNEPMIIRTFIEHYEELSSKMIYTFSTSASSEGNIANKNISDLLNAKVISNLHVINSMLKDVKTLVHDWLLELNLLKETQNNNGVEKMNIKMMIGNKNVDVIFENNCATKALKEKLKSSSVTIHMDDYGSFEKVGGLGFDLPTCNEQITTEPCDIVLYQGNQLVIFYGTNSWSYTRIGKIIGLQINELKNILGKGSIIVTLSLESN